MSAAKHRITAAEYLAFERQAESKHEFINGQIVAMAGTSPEHSLIVMNVGAELRSRLRARGCRTYSSDLRVKISPTGSYVYPDVTVVCGTPELEEAHLKTLLNPTLIVEVLSPSTETFDRGDKFDHYRMLTSLREYILVAQDKVRVERYVRQQESDDWLLTVFRDPGASVALLGGACEVPLSEVYAFVEFAGPGPRTGEVDADQGDPGPGGTALPSG
jgi:Uma2 family endonuclease